MFVEAINENTCIIRYQDARDTLISSRNAALISMTAKEIAEQQYPWLLDLVPSYSSLLVYYDPADIDHYRVRALLRSHEIDATSIALEPSKITYIPVYYGAEVAPDLDEVARYGRCSIDELIRAHTAKPFRVYSIGFAPGFAYLGTLPEQIACPRKASPRPHIRAGSVAIADTQTAIYPQDSPGGWQIIGRTPSNMFKANSRKECLVKVGEQVQFTAISKAEFLKRGGSMS